MSQNRGICKGNCSVQKHIGVYKATENRFLYVVLCVVFPGRYALICYGFCYGDDLVTGKKPGISMVV
jgi:hypothetical protein